MEKLGPNLQEWQKKCGNKFSLNCTIKIAVCVFRALNELWTKHIIYCDMKPENLCTSEDGSTIKLTDFGLSKYQEPDPLKANQKSPLKTKCLTGTSRYMAIESHQQYQHCMRHDLEASMYMLKY